MVPYMCAQRGVRTTVESFFATLVLTGENAGECCASISTEQKLTDI